MADKSILFSGPMVRALLAGTKTKTRRVLKPQPPEGADLVGLYAPGLTAVFEVLTQRSPDYTVCLRHMPKDQLYVREHWRVQRVFDDWAPVNSKDGKPVLIQKECALRYVADNPPDVWLGKHRQGMHMPRWASRLTLTVTDVRVERLQDISEGDAIAEGIEYVDQPDGDFAGSWSMYDDVPAGGGAWSDPRRSYHSLWDRINGTDWPICWNANPWVAVYTFTVERGNIDHLVRAA